MNTINKLAVCLVAILVLSMLAPLAVAGANKDAETGLVDSSSRDDYMRFININGFEFDPLQEMPEIPEALRFGADRAVGLAYYLVQFDGPIVRGMKEDLAETGAAVLRYVSYNAFVVRANQEIIAEALALPHVRWAGLFEPAYKLSPRLGEDYDAFIDDFLLRSMKDSGLAAQDVLKDRFDSMLADMDRGHSGPLAPREARKVIPVEISVFEEWNLPLVLDALDRLGARNMIYSHQSSGLIKADIDRALLAQVSRETGVMWIDRCVPNVFYNDIARWVVQSGDGVSYATPVHEHGIFGTGQIVTVCDSGIDYEHDAFEDPSVATPGPTHRKVTDYYVPSDADGDDSDQGVNHGTHTSATVAGDDGTWHVYDGDYSGSGGTYGPHDGIAFDATIHVQDTSLDGHSVHPPSDFHDLYQEAMDRGSWIHTNSWGSFGATYATESAQTDDFIWDNQDFLVLFSAGNDGDWPGAMNPEACAKNVIGVGATYNGPLMEDVAYFSSRGPVEDGRLKPDVMAPGVATWSALGGDPDGQTDEYTQLSGTSMSAPTVAGSCALIRQYYMDGWYPTGTANPVDAFVPSAALIKATVINSAREMTGAGAYGMDETWYPNNNQGWGRVTLDDALYFEDDSKGLMIFDERGGLLTEDVQTYNIAMSDVSNALEVTLVWSDYPGTAYSSPNLVNDLDLIVRAPDGTIYLGNQFEGFNPGESVKDPDEHDRLNNVECVLVLSDLQIGMWTVEISAHNVPMGPQPYALVITGSLTTDAGVISMDKNYYRSDDTIIVRVSDTGLDLDPEAIDTTWALVSSDTELSPENITLTETANSSSVFVGEVALDQSAVPVPGDNLLQVQNLDQLNATYFDEDNGLGESVWVVDIATVDDDPPVISNVTVINLRPRSCTVLWDTDEPCNSTVTYGTSVPLSESLSSGLMTTSHAVSLKRLTDNETYYFMVESGDRAGNSATDDNASDYYTFTTPIILPLQPSSEEWPTYQNNIARLGSSPSIILPPLELIWMDYVGQPAYTGSAVFSDGVLVTASTDGYLRALDPYSGEESWAKKIGEHDNYLGMPTIADGVIFATASDDYNGSQVMAFDLYTGEHLWTSDLKFMTILCNLGYSNSVVFGGGYDCVFAMDAEDGSTIWIQPAAEAMGGVSVANGIAYASSLNEGRVWALDEYTGDILWDCGLSYHATGPPSVSGEAIFITTFEGDIQSFDAFTGDELWSVKESDDIFFGTPVCDGAAIYISSLAGGLRAYDAFTGEMLWDAAPDTNYSLNSIALANGYLYSVSLEEGLSVYDASDGQRVANYSLNGMGLGPPTISGGWVWVCGYDGYLHAFKGLTPVELLVHPSSQTNAVVPGTTTRFDIEVWNAGYLHADTIDVEMSLGMNAWDASLYEFDGLTPLEDTDGDLVIDIGLLEPNESRTIAVLMTIPEDAGSSDSETVSLTFTSSVDTNLTRRASVIAFVPGPGVSIGPSAYSTIEPGESMICTMEVVNEGGMQDIIDIERSSESGWSTLVFEEDGVTPLIDTDGDLVVDIGTLAGLESTTIVVHLVPPDDMLSTYYGRATIAAWSSLDPTKGDEADLIADLLESQTEEWPTFRSDSARSGINPADYELPLSYKWSSGSEDAYFYFSSPIISDRMVYYANSRGYLTAVDVSTGEEIWTTQLASSQGYPGTPTAAYGLVYVIFPIDIHAVAIFAVDGRTGEVSWSYEVDSDYPYQGCTPAVARGSVYWQSSRSSAVYANDALTGELLWSYREGFSYGSMATSYWGGIVYVNDEYRGLTAVDAESGEELWVRLDCGSSCAPVIAEGVLYINDGLGFVWAIDPVNGTTIWSKHLGIGYFMEISSPLRVGDMVYTGSVTDTGDSMMYALNASTGDIVWCDEYGWLYDGLTSPAYCNGIVYAMDVDGVLRGWDALTGDNLLTLDLEFFTYGSPAIGDGYLVACTDDGYVQAYGFAGVGVAVSADVSPETLELTIGEAGFLELTVLDVYGNPVPGRVFEWESVEGLGSVFPVTEDGHEACYVAGNEAGTDTVLYTSIEISGSVQVEILPGAAYQIVLDPLSASVSPGDIIQFSASVIDGFGNEHDGAEFTWSASESIGTIDSDGTFTASTIAGTTGTVTVCCEDLSASAAISVVPGEPVAAHVSPSTASLTVGTTLKLEANVTDEFGNEVHGMPMEWYCTAGTIIPIGEDNVSAIFVAPVEPGDCQLMVCAEALDASALLVVSAGELDRIELSPSDVTTQTGQTVRIHAYWKDVYGNDLDEFEMEWASDIGDLTVGADGLWADLHAGSSPGMGVVTVAYGDVTASVTVTVLKGPTSTISSTDMMLLSSVLIAAVAAVLIIYMLRRRPGAPTPTNVDTPDQAPPPP